MKIIIYGICKNEENEVDGFMDSCIGADGVYILDTGSTDETVKKLEARGAIVNKAIVRPWRFDMARNISLSMVPEDADVCISLDMDERLQPGWREDIEENWKSEHTRALYFYVWNWNPDGTPGLTFWKDLIHTRFNSVWKYPTHETMCVNKTNDVRLMRLQVHQFMKTKPRPDDLPLLRMGVEENPTSDRCSHYLGREYMFRSMYEEAIAELTRYLSLPTATWKDERSASMRYIGLCHARLGRASEAKVWMFKAVQEAPHLREPWIELARLFYENDWPGCLWAASNALKITERPTSYISESWAWGEVPYDLASIACWHLGLKDKALECCAEAIRLAPNDERIKKNLAFMTDNSLTS